VLRWSCVSKDGSAVEFTRWKRRLRAVDWRIVPVLALVVIATATSYGYHRLLLAQRDLVEHTYEAATNRTIASDSVGKIRPWLAIT
jgi:hypothetical protein